jgi:hypothetical protein
MQVIINSLSNFTSLIGSLTISGMANQNVEDQENMGGGLMN